MSKKDRDSLNDARLGEKIPDDQIQEILLSILKEFDAYCNRHGLTYYVSAGTLLGAVRHHGFIPWDDDVDVIMPKPSYYRLEEIARKDPYLDDGHRYRVLLHSDETNVLPFIKIEDTHTIAYEYIFHDYQKIAKGLWLDVFCLSYVEDDPSLALKNYKKNLLYSRFTQLLSWGSKIRKPYRYFYPLMVVGRIIANAIGLGNEYWIEKQLDIQRNSPDTGKLRANLVYALGFSERYPDEDFSQALRVPFEDGEVSIPVGYEDILERKYGQWKKLPPEDQRMGHHGYDAFWRVRPGEN
ncbi:LicD family protein [Collinsella provencensis]|uniref:LicD family protein n=1 Tax=Collinsella provencensis TaxID=1937461 RepID=UPI00131CF990|nr:LicD family protein [Collinsella provencensis]